MRSTYVSSRGALQVLVGLVAVSALAQAPIPGVHVPLPIDPTVQAPNSVWLNYAYLVFLRRAHDPAGYAVNLNDMNNNGLTQSGVFNAFVGSQEWTNNPSLSDKSAFVQTVYSVLLLRQPSQQVAIELQLRVLRSPRVPVIPGSPCGPPRACLYEQEINNAVASILDCHGQGNSGQVCVCFSASSRAHTRTP